MTYSLVLFVHIAGVVGLFAGLALEAFGIEPARKIAPRISGIAMALTVLSGFYLGARFGVMREVWVRASMGAIVVMAAAGVVARRSERLSRISLRVRAAFGVAVVFLMVAKPDAVVSSIVLGLAVVGSALVALPIVRKPRIGQSSYMGA